MNPMMKTARTAGLVYCILVLSGIFSLMYVPTQLFVRNDAAATMSNIVNNEMLFRLGMLASIVCYIAFLFVPLILYKLLHPVNKMYAVAMVALAVVSVPVSLVNLLDEFRILTLIDQPGTLPEQVMLHLRYYNNGIDLATIFWGLWLFPFGYLVYRSGFLPKILGILLMAGCVGDIISFAGDFLIADFTSWAVADYLTLPASLGEIGTCLWLMIMGVKTTTSES